MFRTREARAGSEVQTGAGGAGRPAGTERRSPQAQRGHCRGVQHGQLREQSEPVSRYNCPIKAELV